MRKALFLLLLSWTGASLWAQTVPDFNWNLIGPNNFGGRTRSLYAAPDGVLWAGSAGGGLWRSSNQGQTWDEVTSFRDYQVSSTNPVVHGQCVSSIAVDASTGTMYVATGDMTFYYKQRPAPDGIMGITTNSYAYPAKGGGMGTGVYVSTDGGQTFSNQNFTTSTAADWTDYSVDNPFLVSSKIVARDGRAFVATRSGVFYSDDKFQTAQYIPLNISTEDPETLKTVNFFDVELGDNGYVYAASNNCLFISTDNGASFSRMVTGTDLPRNPFDDAAKANPTIKIRMEVAVAPSDPSVVYVTETNNLGKQLGVWRSTDRGETWVQIGSRSTDDNVLNPNLAFAPFSSRTEGNYTGKGLYAQVLAVSPRDPYKLFFGSQLFYTYDTVNGWRQLGIPFQQFTGFTGYMPPNQMSIAFPSEPSQVARGIFYVGTDREIVRVDSSTNTINIASGNYSAAMVYHVSPAVNGRLFGLGKGTGFFVGENEASRNYRVLSVSRQAGIVHTSKANPAHLIMSQPKGVLLRSLNGGNLESFYGFPDYANGAGDCGNPCGQATGPDCDVIDKMVASSTEGDMEFTPFVMDEVFPMDSVVVDSNETQRYPTYAYTARNEYVWNVTRPFGTTQATLPLWSKLHCSKLGLKVYPTAMVVSGDTNHTLYVGTSTGQIFRFLHAHEPWRTVMTEISPALNPLNGLNVPNSWISSLAMKAYRDGGVEKHLLVATYGSYVDINQDGHPSEVNVVFSLDALDASPGFSGAKGDLPTMPVYAAYINPDATDASAWVALGTEAGIYVTDALNESPIWKRKNDGGMSRVPVLSFSERRTELESRPAGNLGRREAVLRDTYNGGLYIATYGKGIFKSGLISARDGQNDHSLNSQTSSMDIATFPNPSTGKLNVVIDLDIAASVSLELMDMQGRSLRSWNLGNMARGGHTHTLEISDLSAGIYILNAHSQHTDGNQAKAVARIVKQ